MSQLYLIECPKCKKDNLFYSLRREDWVCKYCKHVIEENKNRMGHDW